MFSNNERMIPSRHSQRSVPSPSNHQNSKWNTIDYSQLEFYVFPKNYKHDCEDSSPLIPQQEEDFVSNEMKKESNMKETSISNSNSSKENQERIDVISNRNCHCNLKIMSYSWSLSIMMILFLISRLVFV